MKKLLSIFSVVWMFSLAMVAQNGNDEFNPDSPLDPGANNIDVAAREAYIDLFEPGRLVQTLLANSSNLTEEVMFQIKKVTIAAPMTEDDFQLFSWAVVFPYAEVVDLSRSSGFDSVPDGAFSLMSYMTTLLLPSCVKNIGEDLFCFPDIMEEIDCYATTPPTVTENTFAGMAGRDDFVVRVPSESVELYRNTPIWSDLNIQALSSNEVSLTAVLPQGDYSGMYIILTDESTGRSQRYLTGNAREYEFVGLEKGHTYTLALQTTAGCVLSETKGIKVDESVTVSIDNVKQAVSVSLAVTDADGEDVTSLVGATWKSGNNIIGQGCTIGGLVPGVKVNCQITLNDELALRYEQPEAFDYTVKEGDNTISIALTTLPQFTPVKGEMKGSKLLLDIAYTPTEEGTEFNPYDLKLTIVRRSTGVEVNDFVINYPEVSFKDTQFGANEQLQVVIGSRSNDFAEQTVNTTADSNGTAFVEADITEHGKADINYSAAEGVSAVKCSIYDGSGKFVGGFFGKGSTVELERLADGNYTAVLMEKNQFFDMVPSITELQQTGLQKGRDYVTASVTMKAGVVNTYNVDVPDFDETPFDHVSGNAIFSSNSTSATAFGYSTLKARVEFKDEYKDRVSNVSLIITIPENARYMEGSLLLNKSNGSFTLNDDRIIIPTSNSELARLCMEHLSNGESRFNAMLEYTLDGKQYVHSYRSILIENKLKICAPESTSSESFFVHGQTVGNADIKVYDKADLIGETKSNSSGSWRAEVRLASPRNNSYHTIYAEITANGLTARSEETRTRYSKGAITLQKMQMKVEDNTLTFNPLTGKVSKKFYLVTMNEALDYTFTAELDNSNPERIGAPRFRVITSDGIIRFINARYNANKRLWTAHTTYSYMEGLPMNMAFDYVDLDTTTISLAPLADEDVSAIEKSGEFLENAIDENIDVDEVPVCTDSLVTMNVHVGEDKYIVIFKDKNYAETVAALDGEDLIKMVNEADTFYVYTECNGTSLSQTYIDHVAKTATCVTIISDDAPAVRQMRKSKGGNGFFTTLDVLSNLKGFGEGIAQGLGYQDILFSKYYYDEMVENHETNMFVLRNLINDCWAATVAYCPKNFEHRVPSYMLGSFQTRLKALTVSMDKFNDKLYDYESKYLNALVNSIATEAVFSLAGGAIKAGAKLIAAGGKGVIYNVAKLGVGSGLANRYSQIKGLIADNLASNASDFMKSHINTDFMGIKQEFDAWRTSEYSRLARELCNLKGDIVNSYKECEEDEPEETNVEVAEPEDKETPTENTEPAVDPSGYVYEAVPENRIEGVTATIYYKANASDDDASATLWNAGDYDQMNPLLTDEDGIYMWNVPKGMWQVRFQKDGYEPTQTEWLPVPPPQLDVNVAMTQLSQPEVTEAVAYKDKVLVTFNKYVRVSSGKYSVMQNGKEVNGAVISDADESGLASSVMFVPENPFTASTISLTISGVKSYAGIAMVEDYKKELPVEVTIEGLYAEAQTAVSCDLEGSFTVTAYPAEAVAGKTLSVEVNSDIVSLVDDDIRFDANGVATIKLMGELPGTAEVKVSIADFTATTTVNVEYDLYRTVGTPVANYPSGEVEKGTEVELVSATEGATIYYTLDGSCPCEDTPSRHEYDGTPITINSDVTINAIAICADMLDSKVATYTYTVTDASGVDAVKTYEVFTEAYYSLSGTRMMPPLRPGLYIHVAKGRNGTMSKKILIK